MHSQSPQQRGEISRPEPAVHFRYKFRQFRRIPLRQTPENKYVAESAIFLELHTFQYCLYGLLLCVPYETARIDEKIVHIVLLLPFRHDFKVSFKGREDMLGVHSVLGTPQSYGLNGTHYSAGVSETVASSPSPASLRDGSSKSREAYCFRQLYQPTTFFICDT